MLFDYLQTAKESADLYFNWLKVNQKGTVSISVKEINFCENGEVELYLAGSLSSLDSIEFCYRNNPIDPNEIKIIQYDADLRLLQIQPSGEAIRIFETAKAKDIQIRSDLKFLVQRVGAWYDTCIQNGTIITLPSQKPAQALPMPKLAKAPSDEQQEAYQGIFASPFSYVWGAPGTGKTQFVLALAALAYLKAGKQVLIVTPTNNAVEQTMRGVLAVLEEADVPLEQVIRLGTPSKSFYEQYPMVCEVPALDSKTKKIADRITECTKYINYRETEQWYAQTRPLHDQYSSQIAEAWEQTLINRNLQSSKKQQKADLRQSQTALSHEIEQLNSQRETLSAYLNKPRSKIAAALQRQKIRECTEERHSIDARLQSIAAESEVLLQKGQALTDQIAYLNLQIEKAKSAITEAVKHLQTVAPLTLKGAALPDALQYISLIRNLSPENMEAASVSVRQASVLLENIHDLLTQKQAAYQGFKERSTEDVEEEITRLEQKKSVLSSYSVSARLENSLIVAMTADRLIRMMLDECDLHPAHVFLDEAAYCPMIKGFVLLSLNVPVTMLGDHMQLPPVCEMGDDMIRKREYESICLWAQSSLFVGAAFSQSISEINKAYFSNSDFFPGLRQFNLHHTYRFGTALAEVLGRFVYTPEFRGADGTNTRIMVLHASRETPSPGHVNHEEASAICTYLQSHPELQEYAILTPYRNQRARIAQLLPDAEVLTIHGSQGREWDTVFVSIVETSKQFFLTTKLINTAVSRAKKQLILVCNEAFWSQQKNHLIGGIVSVADTVTYSV